MKYKFEEQNPSVALKLNKILALIKSLLLFYLVIILLIWFKKKYIANLLLKKSYMYLKCILHDR